MDINKFFLRLFFLLMAIASINFQCKKRFGCANTVYNFEIGVKAYPDYDSINIRDTIWFEINTPDTLRDIQSNELINYSGVENLGSVISIEKLDGNNFTIKALKKFEFILINGTEVSNTKDPDLFKEYLLKDSNGYYRFKLGIIPLEVGTFRLIFGNASNVYRKSDECTKAAFSISFRSTNQHYYLNPNFQGGSFPAGGDYYFYVK